MAGLEAPRPKKRTKCHSNSKASTNHHVNGYKGVQLTKPKSKMGKTTIINIPSLSLFQIPTCVILITMTTGLLESIFFVFSSETAIYFEMLRIKKGKHLRTSKTLLSVFIKQVHKTPTSAVAHLLFAFPFCISTKHKISTSDLQRKLATSEQLLI